VKKTYCASKDSKKHTIHKVSQYKTGKASLYAQGAPSPYMCPGSIDAAAAIVQ